MVKVFLLTNNHFGATSTDASFRSGGAARQSMYVFSADDETRERIQGLLRAGAGNSVVAEEPQWCVESMVVTSSRSDIR